MTRINVIPPYELADQWLIAEYRELPRVIKQDISTIDAPKQYCLGRGHVKWAKKHSFWLILRYLDITQEMLKRGFKVNFSYDVLYQVYESGIKEENNNDYIPNLLDITVNRLRLIEKYKQKPSFYKWTNAIKPNYL